MSGFSDGGIAILNGNRNLISGCRVRYTGQGISYLANAIDVYGNIAIGNRISDTGTYNGLHLEGSFGDDTGGGQLFDTVLSGNTVINSREAGINIEVAPRTSCVGNTVRNSGFSGTPINMGIKLYGGQRSTIVGNVISASNGYAIVVGANSGECSVSGNTTSANAGSLLLTDSAGTQVTLDVAIGINSFGEGDIVRSGNVSVLNRTAGFKFSNAAVTDANTLDWYEEGVFTPVVRDSANGGTGNYTNQQGRFTRIGNMVNFTANIGYSSHSGTGDLQIAGLPYAADPAIAYALQVYNSGLKASAGSAVQAFIPEGHDYVALTSYTPATGEVFILPMSLNGGSANPVPAIVVSGTYKVAPDA